MEHIPEIRSCACLVEKAEHQDVLKERYMTSVSSSGQFRWTDQKPETILKDVETFLERCKIMKNYVELQRDIQLQQCLTLPP